MRRWIGPGILLLVVAAGVGYHLLSKTRSRPVDGAGRRTLPTWEMVGCWEIRLTSWTATPEPAPASDSGSAGPPPRSLDPAPRPAPGAVPLPRGVEPPGTVMLLPDSVDLWGRVLGSYRAVALGPEEPVRAPIGTEARRARSLRWFTARDTLWLIWREEGTRAGVALTRHEGRLRGAARALSDSFDLSAGAEAWPLNCATGAIDSTPAWRRR